MVCVLCVALPILRRALTPCLLYLQILSGMTLSLCSAGGSAEFPLYLSFLLGSVLLVVSTWQQLAACYTSWPCVHNHAVGYTCSLLHVQRNTACYTSWPRVHNIAACYTCSWPHVQCNAACYTSWPRVHNNAACYICDWPHVQHNAACYTFWPRVQHIAVCLLFYLVISLGRVVCMPLSFSHVSSISRVLTLYFSLVPPQNYTIMITGQILAVANGINGRRHPPCRTTRVDPRLDPNVVPLLPRYKCRGFKHRHCKGCRTVSLSLDVTRSGYCGQCSRKSDHDYYLINKLLPIWYDNGQPQYHVPDCLL
jgi:hypothetical protein